MRRLPALAAAATLVAGVGSPTAAAQDAATRDVTVTGATARTGWQKATSQHFVVYANDSSEHVRAFTQRLETFDKAIRVWHVTPEDRRGPSARVTVFVVANLAEIQKLAGDDEVAGFYEPRVGTSVAFTPRRSGTAGDYGLNAQAILFHEYTHHWMLTTWADAAFPPWFVEGFAELHATARFANGGVTFGANPGYRSGTVGRSNLLSTDRLLQPDPGHLSGAERDALYSRGWLLTHYLTFDGDRRGQLAAYVRAINAGQTPQQAGQLLGNASTLDQKMDGYGRRQFLPSMTIPASDLAIGEVTVRPLSPAEAAVMPAFLLSRRGVTARNAAAVADQARRAAATYPTDGFVLNELAEAEYDACSADAKPAPACFARAETAADRALAVEPASMHALLYKGMAEQAVATMDKSTEPARWAGIRRLYLRANKADPEEPEPLRAFYRTFAAAGQAPTPNAQAGLLYAYALAPYDAGLRMDAARVYLQQDKPADARVALGPVAYNLDVPARAARANTVLAALGSGGVGAALAALDAKPDKDAKGRDAKGS